MSKNLQVLEELSESIRELDHKFCAWIFKWQVMDLRDKAELLSESVSRLEGTEKQAAVVAAEEFLTVIKPVISELQKSKKIGA